jgi:MFS family permease
VSAGQISEQRTRRARIGAAACFLLTGVISASWASRVPAIKDGLSDGQFAMALLGLEAGAVIGLQLGGLVVPHTGSRRALIGSLLAFSAALFGPAFAPSLLLLGASLFAFAALNSVVDVAMNAQGVAVQRLMGRPVLSGLHAMHSLGGVLGAGAGALAARLGATPPQHFLSCAMAAVVVGLAAWSLLLPSRVDPKEEQSEDGAANTSGLRHWFSGWSVSIALLGALAFCFTLAEGAGLNWSAVYVADALGGDRGLRRDRAWRLFGGGDTRTLGWRQTRLPPRTNQGVPGGGRHGRGGFRRRTAGRRPGGRVGWTGASRGRDRQRAAARYRRGGQHPRPDTGHGRRARLDPRLPGILRGPRARRGLGEPFQPTCGVGATCPLRPSSGLRGGSGAASGIKFTRGN